MPEVAALLRRQEGKSRVVIIARILYHLITTILLLQGRMSIHE